MNKTVVVIVDKATRNYLCNGLKSLTNTITSADHYPDLKEALRALTRTRVTTDVEFVETVILIEERTIKTLSKLDVILLRNSHLDATHVGVKGNPYFYYCNEDEGIDYCLDEGSWSICSWSEGDKPRSQAKEFIRINFE